MKATETPLVKFLQGTKQFVIPIYQRTYSWTEKQCEQLWNDIIQVSKNSAIHAHFIGSIVYIEKGLYQVSSVPQLQVIDGQQRLTTLSLLLTAFGKVLEEKGNGQEITKNKINNYFLFNSDEVGEKRYKLILTQSDKETLTSVLEGKDYPHKYSKNIRNNYKFFREKLYKNSIDLDALYMGICKLIIVDISLDSNYDNPQLIFESLNSTGLDLSQADLIRNFVLMGLDSKRQEEIYNNFWFPIERDFGHAQGSEYFDRFMRDYLTIKTGQIPNIGEVYSTFKDYLKSANYEVEKLVSDIRYSSKFYSKLAFEREEDPLLNHIIQDINTLKVDVAFPFLLEVYVDFDKKLLTKQEVLETFKLVESYVFRRTICDIPTNSLNKTFANLHNAIDKDNYLQSLKAILVQKDTYRRFPNDIEFKENFMIKNIYNSKIRKYLFDKLENYGRKELVKIDNYSIEHIMPQNKNLSEEWKSELGEKYMEIHEKYLHTIGNLTLTGYNPELNDRPFLEKRNMKGGFADSPIRLNFNLSKLERWNESEIQNRAQELAQKALDIWEYPKITQEVLQKYKETEEDIEEEFEEEEIHKPRWEERFANASFEVQQNIKNLLKQLETIPYIQEPYNRWLFLYTTKPIERKNLFAIISCGKNTSNVIFRMNPDTFQDNNNKIRQVVGWFFPRGTERRISLTNESIPQILRYLEHAYTTTSTLVKKY